MIDIEYIMDLIDWNNSESNQLKGIKMADEVENLDVFLQPCDERYSKNVWNNCALILSKKSDKKLQPYLTELFEWLQDLNWPGAICILERLINYTDSDSFEPIYNQCIQTAKSQGDEIWESNLAIIKNPKEFFNQ